jgi:2-hydroxy-6-oxonona-2,4-dienedioate hydrolase
MRRPGEPRRPGERLSYRRADETADGVSIAASAAERRRRKGGALVAVGRFALKRPALRAGWRAGSRPGARGPVSQWVTVNGLRMHARASRGAPSADAPTIVLVHGLGMSSRYMEPLLDELAPNARVLAPDLPGYGRSASPRKRLTLAGMADALDAWMGAVGIDSAVVAGNSLGAQVIAQLGVRHPDRLTRAVLVGPTRDPSIGGPFRHTLRLALDAPLERPALIGVAVRDYLRAGPKLMYRLFGEALRHREEDQLRHLGVPTLIVRGQRDPICTQGWVEQINRLVPTSRLVVIDGAAHAVNFSAAPQLAHAIRTFLSDPE